jgi:hypothetical protein
MNNLLALAIEATASCCAGGGFRAPSIEPVRTDDIGDAVAYIVTRHRRVTVNEILIRTSEQTW